MVLDKLHLHAKMRSHFLIIFYEVKITFRHQHGISP